MWLLSIVPAWLVVLILVVLIILLFRGAAAIRGQHRREE